MWDGAACESILELADALLCLLDSLVGGARFGVTIEVIVAGCSSAVLLALAARLRSIASNLVLGGNERGLRTLSARSRLGLGSPCDGDRTRTPCSQTAAVCALLRLEASEGCGWNGVRMKGELP